MGALENVHEEALQTLSDKLGDVEQHLVANNNAEGLMHQISSKFSILESRLQSQSTLNERVKSLEARSSSSYSSNNNNNNNNNQLLHDRIAALESKLSLHSDLHGRVNHLESKLPNHSILSDRVSRVESQLRPDPEHDRLIMRINSKLDTIESSQKMKTMLQSNASSSQQQQRLGSGGSSSSNNNNSSSASFPSARLGASSYEGGGGEEDVRSLRDRIDKLTTLRSRYAREEKELMG